MNTPLTEMIKKAGELMLHWQNPQVFAKGAHADFVTEADIAVQALVVEELAKKFPQAKFFAEEKKDNVLTDELTFIIDPIDGTTNYFRRRNASLISIGAVENRKPVFGALYDPYQDELYWAEKDKGAWCNGEKLQVSDVPMDRAIISLGTSPYHEDLMALTGRTVGELLPHVADFRRTGSAALEMCHIAKGLSDGAFEWILQPWDYCAGTLLVEEAGGRCGNIFGGEVTYEEASAHMAANARIYDELQALLQKIYNG